MFQSESIIYYLSRVEGKGELIALRGHGEEKLDLAEATGSSRVTDRDRGRSTLLTCKLARLRVCRSLMPGV